MAKRRCHWPRVAALLWTLHPLQTEAVTYISQRAESLMGLFYLLTLYGFIRSVTAESRNCWLILSVAACFGGMATKQVMVTAPVLVLLYDRAFISGSFRSALANRRWYYASLAATWLWLGFLMHRSVSRGGRRGFQEEVGWPTYALTELRVVTDYLKLAFWPHPLVFDYGTEILATDPLAVAPYALILAAILVGVVIAWRRSPMAGFLGAWFFLILAPTSTVVPIAEQPMAESRMYLPLAAVVVLVTLLGYALGRRRAFVASRPRGGRTRRADRPEKPRLPQRTEHLGRYRSPAISPLLSRTQQSRHGTRGDARPDARRRRPLRRGAAHQTDVCRGA
jgi:hypothetical protein